MANLFGITEEDKSYFETGEFNKNFNLIKNYLESQDRSITKKSDLKNLGLSIEEYGRFCKTIFANTSPEPYRDGKSLFNEFYTNYNKLKINYSCGGELPYSVKRIQSVTQG